MEGNKKSNRKMTRIELIMKIDRMKEGLKTLTGKPRYDVLRKAVELNYELLSYGRQGMQTLRATKAD
jgi:hypothetical protein